MPKNWTLKERENVLWTDEFKFELFGCRRNVYVRRKTEERLNDKCVLPTVKLGGGSVLVYA